MNTNTYDAIKTLAVETHSRQADEFARSYTIHDPYLDCFNYSRYRLDGLFERLLPKPSGDHSLLDVGCGTGHHLQRYAALGYRVAGVDGSEEMLRHAQTNNPGVDLRHCDVEFLPFADASFDVVVAIEVFRYLPDLTRTVAEIHRVLKPGGVCLVTASPLLSLNGYPIVNRVAAAIPMGGFVRLKQFFTTSGAISGRFRRAGFSRTEVHGVYFGPVNWIERLAPSRITGFLKAWEKVDRALADRPVLRELSNMFLVRAVR